MKNIGDFGRSLSRTGGQSFFGEPWAPSKYVERENLSAGKKRNILQKNGYLRKSLQYELDGQSIIFSSNMPYAQIHNEGGKISHPGGTAFYKKKDGELRWVSNAKAAGKNYARTKAHEITIPQRQFIGQHAVLDKEIQQLIDEVLKQ